MCCQNLPKKETFYIAYLFFHLLSLLQFEDLSSLANGCLQQQIMFALTLFLLLLVYAFAAFV
jgi:hypothetical protein